MSSLLSFIGVDNLWVLMITVSSKLLSHLSCQTIGCYCERFEKCRFAIKGTPIIMLVVRSHDSRSIRDAHELIKKCNQAHQLCASQNSRLFSLRLSLKCLLWSGKSRDFIRSLIKARCASGLKECRWQISDQLIPFRETPFASCRVRIGCCARRNLNFGRQTCCASTRFHLSIKRQASSILNGDRGALNMAVLGWARLAIKSCVLESGWTVCTVVFRK